MACTQSPVYATAFAILVASHVHAGVVQYVDAASNGPVHDGSTWCNAYLTLSEAIAGAAAGSEIRVAHGTYRPDPFGLPNLRMATFQLDDDMTIRGGYAGCGAADPDERDTVSYETVLSGDLNHDDDVDPANIGDNSYHVVLIADAGPDTVLDGFTITAGNADGNCCGVDDGGGIFIADGSPTLVNGVIRGNRARDDGGGLFSAGSPHLVDCAFIDNVAGGSGGGLFNNGPEADVRLTNCEFSDNTAGSGGALYTGLGTSPVLVQCSFTGNAAGVAGGAILGVAADTAVVNSVFQGNSAGRGGAIACSAGSATLVNCALSGNHADAEGGAMYNVGSVARLGNCALSANTATGFGGGLYNASGSAPELSNCILWDNFDSDGIDTSAQIHDFPGVDSEVDFSCVAGGWGGSGDGNIATDPRFVKRFGLDGIVGSGDDDLRIKQGSPCQDAGASSLVLEDLGDLDGDGNTGEFSPFDIDGQPRFGDDPCVVGVEVDMGISEYARVYAPLLHVDAGRDGLNDGRSWRDAIDDLQTAFCTAAHSDGVVEELWIAGGTHTPSHAGGHRGASFDLINGLAVRGGFAGTETSADQRVPGRSPTVLSGDLNGDDRSGGDNAENSYNVVQAVNVDASGVLDGVTVTAGNADGPCCQNDRGGGLLNLGGMTTIHDCKFLRNQAHVGGGAYTSGTPTIRNAVFAGNIASVDGGALYNSGGAALRHCTIFGNAAGVDGGGIYGTNVAAVTDSILWDNSDAGGTDQSAQISGIPPEVNYTCVMGWTGAIAGTGNFNSDPLFVNAAGIDGITGTEDDDLRLTPNSPAINTGDPDFINDEQYTDHDGHARVLCDRTDMGPYEFGMGDDDCDRDIDIDDFIRWTACQANMECEAFDFNADGVVDLLDFGRFQAAFTGPRCVTITAHPTDAEVCHGDAVAFYVETIGSDLLYQWQHAGDNISGATDSTLALDAATFDSAGAYRVIITAACETVESNSAELSVIDPAPEFTTQPAGRSYCVGETIALFSQATEFPSYQWFKDDADIPGATAAFLFIAGAATTDSGVYHVVATGRCNTSASDGAVVTVTKCGDLP